MKASFLDFRKKPGAILRALERNETVTITYRGRTKGIIHPVAADDKKPRIKVQDHPAFGMWADREDMADVEAYLRRMRKGRFSDR